MQKEPEIEDKPKNPTVERMEPSRAFALITILCAGFWVMVGSVFSGGVINTNTVAEDRELKELLEFAPAAGPSQEETQAPVTPCPTPSQQPTPP
ncbi:MAG: hypothetical protein O3B74_13095 [Proteobacteria bacterium]|nr:hypothetical protein [Pseudomonadota bacterium]